jgi:hypothetical protein
MPTLFREEEGDTATVLALHDEQFSLLSVAGAAVEGVGPTFPEPG